MYFLTPSPTLILTTTPSPIKNTKILLKEKENIIDSLK